jgi:signal transduction histidine kinase
LLSLLLSQTIFVFGQEKTVSRKEMGKILKSAKNAYNNYEVEKSLKLANKALKLGEETTDYLIIARSYNIIALNFQEYYDINISLDYFKKSLYNANLSKNDSVIGWVNTNIGSLYIDNLHDFKNGIYFYKKGLEYNLKTNDTTEAIYTRLNMASAYLEYKQLDNTIKVLKDVQSFIEITEEKEAKTMYHRLLGDYYSQRKQSDKAILNLNQALKIIQSDNSNFYIAIVAQIYKSYYLHYKSTNQLDLAFDYLEKFYKLEKEIFESERVGKVNFTTNQIQVDEFKKQISKIENEKNIQSSDLKESKLIMILFVVIFLILLILLFSLFRNNRFRELRNQELRQANEELIEAKDNAEQASRLKTQFVSTISHELRTPLYGVVGITNIILDEHKELKNSPHLNSLKFSARYLLSLVNDLLQINKIEENKVVLEKMVFNLEDEFHTIIDSLEFISAKNKNKIIKQFDASIPELLVGDKLRLSQIFINLISNALKFTYNGEVTIVAKKIKTEETKCFIHFEVKDTGVGIAKDDQEKIFEKFVQIERKEGDYQGTGLGLSIVKKLIELFDSKIHVESEEGIGTTFSFEVAFLMDEKSKNEIIHNIDVDLSTVQTHKILVVEDNKINQVVTKKILEKNNFVCEMVEDGYAAINLLETNRYDLILMDINMPIINGFETTKLIRKKGITIPIIALTAFDKQEIIEQALSSGMNDILVKPFESGKLFQIISNFIDN